MSLTQIWVVSTIALLSLFVVLGAASTASVPNDTLPLSLSPTSRSSTSFSVSAPEICLRDIECGPKAFCSPLQQSGLFGTCKPRLSVGTQCETHASCAEGAFCIVTAPPKLCTRQAARGEKCNPVQANVCLPGLTCTPPKNNPCIPALACDSSLGRCQPDAPGKEGATCQFDRDCDQNDGFYCMTEPGVCTRKKPDGAQCGIRSDNRECQGFCLTGFGIIGGICAPTQPLGGLCTENRHCTAPFNLRPRLDRVICNLPRSSGLVGVCAKTSQLKRKLGDPCNYRSDLCDARRGLSCRWASSLKRAACQHRFDLLGDGFSYCKPGSPLSRCPGPQQFFPTECRTQRVVPGERFPSSVENFTRCSRKRRFIRPGVMCSDEADTCQRGSVCRIIPGVLPMPTGRFSRFGPPSTVYCVRTLKAGSQCNNAKKFRELCDNGLQCVSGNCKKSSGEVKNTHAALNAPCSSLPCSPGLTCGENKVCETQKVVLAFGKLCKGPFDDRMECRKGLVCRTGWNPRGFKRCQRPKGVGAYCEADSWCSGKLRCPVNTTAGGALQGRRCYDPTKALSLGQQCNPRRQIFGPRCANIVDSDGTQTSFRPLRCLRTGKNFTCQVDVGPFGLCDLKDNRVCGDSRFVCREGVCLPK